MNILFFTYDFPYPLDSGGKVRAYHLLSAIGKRHKVTLISFYRDEKQREYMTKLNNFCASVHLLKRRGVASIGNLWHLGSFPFPAAIYANSSHQGFVNNLINTNRFDLIHYESFYTTVFLNKQIKIPQLVGTENIEWKIYRDYAAKQQNPIFRKILMHEAIRTRKFEIDTWKAADTTIAVSEENAGEIAKESGRKVRVVRNGVDLSYYSFKPKKKINAQNVRILFVGNFNYIQNTDAVEWLLNTILPQLKYAHLTVAGKGSNKLPRTKTGKVSFIEEVDDMRKLYSQNDILLAPIRIGSGTKFKILEAMAVGLPVVTTSVGIEGIAAEKQIAIVEDDVEGLINGILKLIQSAGMWQKLISNARLAIEKKYDWKIIAKELEQVYEKTIHNYR